MKYERFENDIVMRLEVGDDINEALLALAKKESIALASVSGIGATDDFTVGVFDLEKQDYEHFRYTGNHEITSLSGNITAMNGKPYVHTHITCAGKSGGIVGGHLLKSRISLTGEIFVSVIGGSVERFRDEKLKINLLDVNK